ncbi:dihydrouridine synthase [Candidatus Kaiserbacteria bacterium]|nr:MAG: dihydrouridine synthase [Candidatus Kaiserbacteria bacterium]
MNFWNDLEKPIHTMAPLEDVTDAAFRAVISKHSDIKHVTFTEFTSADGLFFADERGQEKLRAKLKFSESERPIVAQLFTSNPERMKKAASIARDLGFDGVDINMGCPDRSVEKQGAGAALIKTPELAKEIILAAMEGAGDLPASVKTRIGYSKNELEEWLPAILSTNPAVVTIHARTRAQMSKVDADWSTLEQAVGIRDRLGSDTLIIGNGDVKDVEDGIKRTKESGADGFMIGRGIFGNPWVFSSHVPTFNEKLEVLIEHSELFEKEFDGIKSFATMRKHFSSYVEGFPGAKELRIKLMGCKDAKEVRNLLSGIMADNDQPSTI